MSQQPPVKSDVTTFIIGVVVGMLVGGSVLTLVLFLVFGIAIGQATKNLSLAFILEYAVAILLGTGAAMAVRRNVGIVSGLLVGLAAGLLGGTALCNTIAGGLNNMH
ncbi:MAG TPA: hypothetical protein VGG89_10230 [Candidatus Baltobacteraceae bacterium]|jgi:hypothetical protein